MTNAITTATAVLAKISAYDPWYAKPSEAIAKAWAEQIALTNLEPADLLAGVTECYRTRGDGFRPLPADVIGAAKALRQDRFQRQPLDALEAHNDSLDERLKPRILELAESKTVDQALKFHRPKHNPLRVGCPHCRAPIGRPCTTGINRAPLRQEPRFHPSRLDAIEIADRNQPPAVSSAVIVADEHCEICTRDLVTANETENGVCNRCAATTETSRRREVRDQDTA